jgi:hypothetical protein
MKDLYNDTEQINSATINTSGKKQSDLQPLLKKILGVVSI